MRRAEKKYTGDREKNYSYRVKGETILAGLFCPRQHVKQMYPGTGYYKDRRAASFRIKNEIMPAIKGSL
jgi:hypothetical protein